MTNDIVQVIIRAMNADMGEFSSVKVLLRSTWDS